MNGAGNTNAPHRAQALSAWTVCLRGMLGGLLIFLPASYLPAAEVEVPVINGDLGPCTADFTVTDSSNKPIFDAKIQVSISYGFMNKRKQELEIGTNSDGKARFEGLPARLKKKPLEFRLRSADQTKSVMHDPEVECHADLKVVIGGQTN